ncbi:MAG: FIST C-terminal domain-containing protein, partial [Cyclobacteriaceae bacterium]|nr:FIST C-terminal domain-containing protein [Cyclobacteriaceae bacterium]
AIVFLSVKQDRKAICDILDKEGIAIFGATTAGEFTDKGVEKDSAAILLIDLDPGAFEIVHEEFGAEKAFNIAKNIGRKGLERFRNPGFVISASDIHQEGKEIVDGILETSGTTTLIGGMAGDDTYEKTTIFSNGFHSHSGLIALIIDLDKVSMKGRAVSGWKPVGTEKEVTKLEDNWILTIDNQPALDVLINFLGMDIEQNTTDKELRDITLNFPLKFYLENKGTLFVPPLMFNKETKGIMVPRNIPEGSKFRFTLPPDFDVIDKVIQSARDIKVEGLDSADAMIIFSCIGRLMTLGPLVNEEIKGLNEVWNVPMAGFFSYGEFGSLSGGAPDYVGTMCSWVALKEK